MKEVGGYIFLIIVFLVCHAALIGNYLPPFRDNVSVAFSRSFSPIDVASLNWKALIT